MLCNTTCAPLLPSAHLRIQHFAVQVRVAPVQEGAHAPGEDVLHHQYTVQGHPGVGRDALQRCRCRSRKGASSRRASVGALGGQGAQVQVGLEDTSRYCSCPGTWPYRMASHDDDPTPTHGHPSLASSPIWSDTSATSVWNMMGGRSCLGPTPSAVARLARTWGRRWGDG